MTEILMEYQLNEKTMALIPAKHERAQTLVMETDGTFYVQESIESILEQACLDGGSSLEGRRKSVIHRIGAKHKVPIPICPIAGIYMFPTSATKSMNCTWFNYRKIIHIEPLMVEKLPSTKVLFLNSTSTIVPVSYHIMDSQLRRTAQCIAQFSQSAFQPNKGWPL
ncbi:competence protein ComK [Massilibacterium senegalense]|uniref:competence protein ComK n=1 Tax=Massilibacterium senegalense TaxID=1632858 RepID=UPI000783797B|nr:competence protein ComK [Massilibacterium senegalense]